MPHCHLSGKNAKYSQIFTVQCSAVYQVVDDVEAVVLAVVGVDAAVSFLPHVILQCGFIPEGFLTVQTLQTDTRTSHH